MRRIRKFVNDPIIGALIPRRCARPQKKTLDEKAKASMTGAADAYDKLAQEIEGSPKDAK